MWFGGGDGGIDVVDIEGDMGEADVARPGFDMAAVGRADILNEFQRVPRPLQIGDDHVGAVDAGHLRDDLRIARRVGGNAETQRGAEEGDRPVEIGHREAGVVGREHIEVGHRSLLQKNQSPKSIAFSTGSPRAKRSRFAATKSQRRSTICVVQAEICGAITTLSSSWNGWSAGLGERSSAVG